jgi:hypothetical protein
VYQLRVANQSVDKRLMTLLLLRYQATMHTLNAQSALVFNDAFGFHHLVLNILMRRSSTLSLQRLGDLVVQLKPCVVDGDCSVKEHKKYLATAVRSH